MAFCSTTALGYEGPPGGPTGTQSSTYSNSVTFYFSTIAETTANSWIQFNTVNAASNQENCYCLTITSMDNDIQSAFGLKKQNLSKRLRDDDNAIVSLKCENDLMKKQIKMIMDSMSFSKDSTQNGPALDDFSQYAATGAVMQFRDGSEQKVVFDSSSTKPVPTKFTQDLPNCRSYTCGKCVRCQSLFRRAARAASNGLIDDDDSGVEVDPPTAKMS